MGPAETSTILQVLLLLLLLLLLQSSGLLQVMLLLLLLTLSESNTLAFIKRTGTNHCELGSWLLVLTDCTSTSLWY